MVSVTFYFVGTAMKTAHADPAKRPSTNTADDVWGGMFNHSSAVVERKDNKWTSREPKVGEEIDNVEVPAVTFCTHPAVVTEDGVTLSASDMDDMIGDVMPEAGGVARIPLRFSVSGYLKLTGFALSKPLQLPIDQIDPALVENGVMKLDKLPEKLGKQVKISDDVINLVEDKSESGDATEDDRTPEGRGTRPELAMPDANEAAPATTGTLAAAAAAIPEDSEKSQQRVAKLKRITKGSNIVETWSICHGGEEELAKDAPVLYRFAKAALESQASLLARNLRPIVEINLHAFTSPGKKVVVGGAGVTVIQSSLLDDVTVPRGASVLYSDRDFNVAAVNAALQEQTLRLLQATELAITSDNAAESSPEKDEETEANIKAVSQRISGRLFSNREWQTTPLRSGTSPSVLAPQDGLRRSGSLKLSAHGQLQSGSLPFGQGNEDRVTRARSVEESIAMLSDALTAGSASTGLTDTAKARKLNLGARGRLEFKDKSCLLIHTHGGLWPQIAEGVTAEDVAPHRLPKVHKKFLGRSCREACEEHSKARSTVKRLCTADMPLSRVMASSWDFEGQLDEAEIAEIECYKRTLHALVGGIRSLTSELSVNRMETGALSAEDVETFIESEVSMAQADSRQQDKAEERVSEKVNSRLDSLGATKPPSRPASSTQEEVTPANGGGGLSAKQFNQLSTKLLAQVGSTNKRNRNGVQVVKRAPGVCKRCSDKLGKPVAHTAAECRQEMPEAERKANIEASK